MALRNHCKVKIFIDIDKRQLDKHVADLRKKDRKSTVGTNKGDGFD